MSAENRLKKLREIMSNSNLDIVALIPGASLRYLTGGVHIVMERPIVLLIPLEGQSVAVIPRLEVPLFRKHKLQSTIIDWADSEGYEGAFRKAFEMLNTAGMTIGVEGLQMRFLEGEVLRRFAPSAEVIAADDALANLRIRKDDSEIQLIRKAIQISETALRQTLQEVRVGMTETEIARRLEGHMRDLGSEGLAFKTLLHGGPNTALSHLGPLHRPIQPGDPLRIDFGAVHQGYRADITRVVFVGEPDAELAAFYNVVRKANEAGRAASKPGVTAESVDLATRHVLVDAGYEHLLRHRTGHGLGLETHEPPYIVEGNKRILEQGMVFTIEPGIYELNRHGVRIEDDVLITADGSESLTTFERDIMIVG